MMFLDVFLEHPETLLGEFGKVWNIFGERDIGWPSQVMT